MLSSFVIVRVLPQVITLESGSNLSQLRKNIKLLQAQGKRAAQRRGVVQPCHQGDSRGTSTALTTERLYKGASPPAHPKNKCQKAQLYTQPRRPLRGPAHRTLLNFCYLPLCSRQAGSPWGQMGLCLRGRRRVSPSSSSQYAGSSGSGSEHSGRCSAAPRCLQGAGCLLPDNKLRARLPLWEVPPPPPQAGDEAEKITHSSLLPPPTSCPAPACSH